MTPPLAERSQNLILQLQHGITSTEPLPLLVQFVVLFCVEIYLLHYVIRSRKQEVFVFSHVRLCVAILLMAAISLGAFRLTLSWRPDAGWVRFLLYYLGAFLAFPMIQSVVMQLGVEVVNVLGKEPIIKDFVRPQLAGNDCNHAIIRRFGLFVFIWYLLIPGMIITAPGPDWIKYVLAVPWSFFAFMNLSLASMSS